MVCYTDYHWILFYTEWITMATHWLFILAKIILDTNINKTTSTF